jgi:hypothetical protein
MALHMRNCKPTPVRITDDLAKDLQVTPTQTVGSTKSGTRALAFRRITGLGAII